MGRYSIPKPSKVILKEFNKLGFNIPKQAEILNVSSPTVAKWNREYNIAVPNTKTSHKLTNMTTILKLQEFQKYADLSDPSKNKLISIIKSEIKRFKS